MPDNINNFASEEEQKKPENLEPNPSGSGYEDKNLSFSQEKKKKFVKPAMIILPLIFFIATAVVASLYTRIWDPGWNFFNLKSEEVMRRLFANIENMKTFHSEVSFGADVEAEIGSADYPATMNYSGSVSLIGDMDKTDLDNIKTQAILTGEAKAEGIKVTFEGEAKSIGDTFYYKINEFPFFSLLSAFSEGQDFLQKGKWIKIEPEDIEKSMESPVDILKKEWQKKVIAEISQILKNKELFIINKEFPGEVLDGKKVYHYDIGLNTGEVKKLIPEIIKVLLEDLTDEDNLFSQSIESEIDMAEYGFQNLFYTANVYDSNARSYVYDFTKLRCDSSSPSYGCQSVEKYAGEMPVINSLKDKYCAYVKSPFDGYYYCSSADKSSHAPTTLITNVFPGNEAYCKGNSFKCPPKAEISKQQMEELGVKRFQEELDSFFNKIGEIKGEIWVGKKDLFPYKISITKEIGLENFSEPSDYGTAYKGKVTVNTEIAFSDINKSIKIEAPSGAKSFKEILDNIQKNIDSSQSSAKKSAIKSYIDGTRVAAEIWYDENSGSGYNGVCNGEDLKSVSESIKTLGSTLRCFSSKKAYCAEADLPNLEEWCADSTGYSGTQAACSAANISCKSAASVFFPIDQETSLLKASLEEIVTDLLSRIR